MDYNALPPEDFANLQNVTIRTTRFILRSMAMKMAQD